MGWVVTSLGLDVLLALDYFSGLWTTVVFFSCIIGILVSMRWVSLRRSLLPWFEGWCGLLLAFVFNYF